MSIHFPPSVDVDEGAWFAVRVQGVGALLSVIVPTYNERDTVGELVNRLAAALHAVQHELVFVDDSTDGTDHLLATMSLENPVIHVIHREGRRGLAAAVVEGIAAARGDVVCVLDGDLQHPPEALPGLLEVLERTGSDLVVASRYTRGGRYDSFTAARRVASQLATAMARALLLRARLVADPLSGFFAFRRSVVDGIHLRPVGYKILLEVLARGRLTKVVEVPYRFDARTAGQSKLTLHQNWEYLLHLGRLLTADPEDIRFWRFCLIGASGVVVNMLVLSTLSKVVGVFFLYAGVVAIVAATTWNFLLNDAITWRDRRSMSLQQKLIRYFQYWGVTALGSSAHLFILYTLTSINVPYLWSNLAGITVAALWNFRTNARWTWRPSGPIVQRGVYNPSTIGVGSGEHNFARTAVAGRQQFVRYLKDGPVPHLEIALGNGASPAPQVSVIIPSLNGTRSHHLAGLLRQLREQPFQQLEAIVVQGDRRQGRAINTAAAIARGHILITMDDDTQLGDPHVIEKLVAAFAAEPTIGIAGVSNCAPPNGSAIVRRAMRELPRRSSPLVESITDSDMAEHPCLAIRKDLFYRVGGEHEWIPRGLDPYLRREVRRHGYRVVIIPDAWIHHLLPATFTGILRQYFRNGLGAAYVQKFYPEFVIEQAEAHDQAVSDRTSLVRRTSQYAGRFLNALISGRWIYLGTLLTYAAGYVWGWRTLREDSL